MRKILKKIGKWFLVLLGVFVGFHLVLLLIIRIHSSGIEEPFLDEHGDILSNSIAIHEDVEINGVPQRITIRGNNLDNPVLLRVHGGPGGPEPPVIMRIFGNDLEDIFTVCYWEQRGAGPAYTTDIPDSTISLTQIVDDGLAVVDYLKKELNRDKIYIEGISWGTAVSAFMVQKKPEAFHAYIGIGQMANQALSEQMSYDFVMDQALKNNDSLSINQLKQIGRPPYDEKTDAEMADACIIERSIVDKFAPFQYQMKFDRKAFLLDNGMTLKQKLKPPRSELDYPAFYLLWRTCFHVNLMRDVPTWEIPVYIMHGDNDHYTETSLAKEYLDSLEAPDKKWFLFDNATHAVSYQYPEKYRSVYINEILKI